MIFLNFSLINLISCLHLDKQKKTVKSKYMNSKEILYSDGNNDECYTQAYCVKPILN